jgi:hypothetical protein
VTRLLAGLLAAVFVAVALFWALPLEALGPAGAGGTGKEALVDGLGGDGPDEPATLLGGSPPDDDGVALLAAVRPALPALEAAGFAHRDRGFRGKSPTAHLRRGSLSPPDGGAPAPATLASLIPPQYPRPPQFPRPPRPLAGPDAPLSPRYS